MSLKKYQNIKSFKNAREQGFTIVELLIVIIVIAILAALVISAYTGIQQKAQTSKNQANAKSIKTAVMSYVTNSSDGNTWPATTAAIESGNAVNVTVPNTTAAASSTNAIQFKTCPTSGAKTGAIISYWNAETSAAVTENLGTIGTC